MFKGIAPFLNFSFLNLVKFQSHVLGQFEFVHTIVLFGTKLYDEIR